MQSIRRTITITTILWVALILAVGQLVVDSVVSSLLISQFDTAMEAKARALVTLTKFDGIEVEMDFADEFMPEFEAPENPEYFELFLSDGSLLERSHSLGKVPQAPFQDQDKEVEIADVELPDGRQGRKISIKFVPQIEDKLRKTVSMEFRPRAILLVSRERESLDQVIQQLHMLIVGTGIVVLIAVMLCIKNTTRRGLSPLVRVKDEISQISPHSIDRRIGDEQQPEELKPIVEQFNRVLDEIEKAFIREREFSSDVAHELRTPVSEIRSLAEVGMRWPDERDIRSYFADIHESSRHLDRLIENLLHLCRSEDGNIELEISQVNLGKLISKHCRNLNQDINDKNLDIELPGGPYPTVLTDAQWMELILHNLIYNAISHSPAESRISVEVRSSLEYCEIEIRNPMIDALGDADLEMIFKRLWRKDLARETSGHVGIGLSLVKSYSELMNLEVRASLTSDNQFCVVLGKIKLV